MRIAVIGSGISGMVAAYLLGRSHEITVFEAASYIGGHSHTVDVKEGGQSLGVDTGFVVFNRQTYPNFSRLIDHLNVRTQRSCMSFSVQCRESGLEYSGNNLNTLFAQRRNLFKPRFYGMVRDIFRFYRDSAAYLGNGQPEMTLGEFLEAKGYGQAFITQHLVPMASSIWSARARAVRDLPLRQFLSFLDNHGFIRLSDQPKWETISGGSRNYVERLTAGYRDRVRLNSPVASVRRAEAGAIVKPLGGEAEFFDHVVMATHSDQSLRLLKDATPREREILGAIPYQKNAVQLHSDQRLLPTNRRARASWNYYLHPEMGRPTVTYHMNRLQRLPSGTDYCVSLNSRDAVSSDSVLLDTVYDHPLLTVRGVSARRRHAEISGRNHTSFCGAYWGYGFHEDGVNSALRVASRFGERL